MLLAALFIAAALSPSALAPRHSSLSPTVTLIDPSGATVSLDVELALTPAQQSVGLMHRTAIEKGMLFVFDGDGQRSFWMKNTLVPLDISFFDSTGTWVSAARMEPCTADPCKTYSSGAPAKYALELEAGGMGSEIGSGWKITWEPGS